MEGDWDYAWISPVVVKARNCERRDAGCGKSVVLRWVEAGVKGMDPPDMEPNKRCKASGAVIATAACTEGPCRDRSIGGGGVELGHESETFCSVQVDPLLQEVGEVCMLR